MRLIDADESIKYLREFRCKECDRRKGMKNGKIRFCYEIGEAPCRACDIGDMIDFLDDISPTVGGWISVKDRLPEQTPSLFSQFKDTDKWSKAMWVMDSETVLVTVAAKGESIVTTGKLQDGKWCTRISPVIEYKVTHWMPMPEPPKEDKP